MNEGINTKSHGWCSCLIRSHIRCYTFEIVVKIGYPHAGVIAGAAWCKKKLVNAVVRIVDRYTSDAMRLASLICLDPSIEKVVVEIVGLLRLWYLFIRDAGATRVCHMQDIISGNVIEHRAAILR